MDAVDTDSLGLLSNSDPAWEASSASSSSTAVSIDRNRARVALMPAQRATFGPLAPILGCPLPLDVASCNMCGRGLRLTRQPIKSRASPFFVPCIITSWMCYWCRSGITWVFGGNSCFRVEVGNSGERRLCLIALSGSHCLLGGTCK